MFDWSTYKVYGWHGEWTILIIINSSFWPFYILRNFTTHTTSVPMMRGSFLSCMSQIYYGWLWKLNGLPNRNHSECEKVAIENSERPYQLKSETILFLVRVVKLRLRLGYDIVRLRWGWLRWRGCLQASLFNTESVDWAPVAFSKHILIFLVLRWLENKTLYFAEKLQITIK